jgi:hypothetical protein
MAAGFILKSGRVTVVEEATGPGSIYFAVLNPLGAPSRLPNLNKASSSRFGMTRGVVPRLALERRAHYVHQQPVRHAAARLTSIAAMRTNKYGFGTLFVFFLSLLFVAASPSAASARLIYRDATVSALTATIKAKAEARPLSENEWLENDAVEGGGDAPEPALVGTSSYPAGLPLSNARARPPAGLIAHGVYRQTPPPTGPPSA